MWIGHWAAVAAAAVVLAGGVASCGGGEQPAPDPEAAREPVLTFLRAVEQRDTDRACTLLTPEASRELQRASRGRFEPQGETLETRRAEVRTMRERTRTCRGAVAVYREQVKRALPTMARRARTSNVVFLDDETAAFGSDQDWVLVRTQGRWRIETLNEFENAP